MNKKLKAKVANLERKCEIYDRALVVAARKDKELADDLLKLSEDVNEEVRKAMLEKNLSTMKSAQAGNFILVLVSFFLIFLHEICSQIRVLKQI